MAQPIKSIFDKSSYSLLLLSNSMRCLLISNPAIDLSSLLLLLPSGALLDPPALPGLAHFLEHIILSGSKSFPDPNEFPQFLLGNCGSLNSATDLDFTSFYFECNSSVFEYGVERFASYFREPLLDEKMVEKNVKVVDTEWNGNKQNDYFKNMQILKNMARKGHPFCKFGMGNQKTLKGGILLQKTREYFEKHFSSNLMTLVAYSKHDLKSLEDLISPHFRTLENKNIDLLSLERLPFAQLANGDINDSFDKWPFAEGTLQKLIKVVSARENIEMSITWTIPYKKDQENKKSREYLWYILNFGGEESLLSLLQSTSLVSSLTFSYSSYSSFLSLCTLRLILPVSSSLPSSSPSLTSELSINISKIMGLVYSYLEFIAKEGVLEEKYKEAQKLATLNFHFTEKNVDMTHLLNIAKRIHNFQHASPLPPPSSHHPSSSPQPSSNSFVPFDSSSLPPPSFIPPTLLIEDQFWSGFDKEDILFELSHLKPSNSLVFLNSKVFEEEQLDIEPYNGALYKIEPLPEIDTPKNLQFKMFAPNPFVPSIAKYQEQNPSPVASSSDHPSSSYSNPAPSLLLSSSPRSLIYYKYNTLFKIPKTHFKLRLLYPSFHASSPFFLKYLQVIVEVALMNLAPLAALIQRALGKLTISTEETGLVIGGEGFTEIIGKMIESVVDVLNNIENSPNLSSLFQKAKAKIQLTLKKRSDVWAFSDEIFKDLLFGRKAEIDIQEGQWKEFLEKGIKQCKMVWFLQGDISSEEVISLAGKLEKKLFFDEKMSFPPETLQIRIPEIPPNKTFVFNHILRENPLSMHFSCLSLYYQFGVDTPRNRVLSYLITYIISDIIYNCVSLKGKLGYSENSYIILRGIISYKIKIHCKTSCSQYALQTVTSLLPSLKKEVFELSDKKFEDLKNVVLLGIMTGAVSLEDDAENEWARISRNEAHIDRDQLEKETLQKVNREDIQAFYLEHFIEKPRKLEIHCSNENFESANDFQLKERIKEKKEEIKVISEEMKFWNELGKYEYQY